jgi:hypothetical protein
MQASEIIAQDAKQHGIDPDKVLRFVGNQIQQQKSILMQHKGSVLLLTNIGRDDVDIHLFTVESPSALLESMKNFLSTAKQSPIKRVYGEADNPGILKMLGMIGLKVQSSDRPEYNWMAQLKD